MRLWPGRSRGRPRPPHEDIERELRTHLELEAEERREAGLAPDEAAYAALRAFGNPTQVKEQIHEMSGWTLLEQVWQDTRYALRGLHKNAGFTTAAVISLALGVGGNTAMFSLVNGVLLRPLSYPEPERLVRVTGYYPKGALVALQERSLTMEVAAFSTHSEVNLTGQGKARRLLGSSVSANLFSVLGAHASIGRTFQPGDDQPGQDGRVLLGHSLWHSTFGHDPGVIGRLVTVDGRDREVVGVMPPEFSFPASGTELWTPLHLDSTNGEQYWGAAYMPLVARLRPEANLQQAQAELRPLIAHIVPLFPFPMGRDWNADATILPLQQELVAKVRTRLLLLLGAVGLVLLVACINVAGLLLCRSAARRKEMALRAALGAGRARMLRQVLTESLVLAFVGGGLGLALAFGALVGLKSVLPVDLPGLSEVGVDGRVLGFVGFLAVSTGLAFGVAPALSASQFNLAQAVKAGGQRSAGGSGRRLHDSLIVGEVGLAVVLVIAAGLLIKSLWLLTQVDPGFRPDRILTVRVSPSQSSCQERPACVALYDELLRRTRRIAGVAEVAAVNAVPLSGEVPVVPVEIEGHPLNPAEARAPLLWASAVTPEYFRIMSVPLLEGRVFTDTDGEESAGVVVVSAATARRYWPGQNAVGKQIRVVWDQRWRTVVGVAGDVREYDLAGNLPAGISGTLYMPYPQSVTTTRQLPAAMSLLVRTAGAQLNVARDVHGLASSLSPNVPVGEVRALETIVSSSTAGSRSMVWVFLAFAGSALILAAVGIYGVLSYQTTQRTYEIGVRIALGATRRSIFGLTLGQSVRLALAGLALGIPAAFGLTRTLTSLLYGITATDPVTFLAVAALMVVTALLAGFLPARRASSVDPLTALRVD